MIFVLWGLASVFLFTFLTLLLPLCDSSCQLTSRKGRWRRERAAEIEMESEAEGRRRTGNVLKGDECYGPGCGTGSFLEPEVSEAVSEDGRRPRAGSYHDGVVVRRGQLRERCTSAAGGRRDRAPCGWDRAAGQGSVSFVGRRAGRRLLEARTERAEAGSDLASFESLFVRRECPDDRDRTSFCLNLVSGPGFGRRGWLPASQDSSYVCNVGVGVISLRGVLHLLFLPLLLPSLGGSLTVVGWFGAYFLLGLGILCIWLSFTVIKVQMLVLSNLL